jgi:hypothetical protein
MNERRGRKPLGDKAQTPSERWSKMKAAREAAGHVRRYIWATPEEHQAVNELLMCLRGAKPDDH